MKVIREDIIASRIKFNVGAQTYRENNFGETRVAILKKLTDLLGIEIEGVETIQAIPIGDKHYEVVVRG